MDLYFVDFFCMWISVLQVSFECGKSMLCKFFFCVQINVHILFVFVG
jgi:hypothetical protein